MERDELLRRLACGELDEDALEIREAVGRDPALAEELAELREVQAHLEGLGIAEREDLVRKGDPRDPIADRVERLTRQRLGIEARSTPIGWLLVAAIAVISVSVWAFVDLVRDDRGPELGDAQHLETLEPRGRIRASEFDAISWRGGGEGPFVVAVHYANLDFDEEPIASSATLRERRWKPNERERRHILEASRQGELRWTVRVVDTAGEQVDSASALFSLQH